MADKQNGGCRMKKRHCDSCNLKRTLAQKIMSNLLWIVVGGIILFTVYEQFFGS